MRGLEYDILYGIIIIIVVLVIIAIIVFGPALSFGKTTSSSITFEEFCIQWSLNGYSEDWATDVKRNNVDYGSPQQNCPSALTNVDVCRKCCKKEVAC